MHGPLPLRLSHLRGWGQLAVDALLGLTESVESMHQTIARRAFVLGKPGTGRTRGITGLVYRSIRAVTRLTGWGHGTLLGLVRSSQPETVLGPRAEKVLAAANGVVGDHLEASRNPLATSMQLRHRGSPLVPERERLAAAVPDPREHVVLLLHGLCMSELGWARGEEDVGARLADELGCTVLHLRYNSGRHISTNGRDLAGLLASLVDAWPVPLERLSLIGHSMGGLVARSAGEVARREGLTWSRRLGDLVCLGSPHLGTPLSRGAHWLHGVLGVSPYTAPIARLGRLCSAGLTDLRHGALLDRDWEGRDRFALRMERPGPVPLPAGVRCLAVAGVHGRTRAFLGDGLVPVDSALGRDPDPSRALAFGRSAQWIAEGVDHLGLLSDPSVHRRLRAWLARG